MRRIWILIFLVLATGCSKAPDQTPLADPFATVKKEPKMSGSFDSAAAAYVLKPGTATIKGVLSSKGRDDQMYKAKFAKIHLIPITAYADEYIGKLFGKATAIRWAASVGNVEERFFRSMRYAYTDKQGKCTFFGVPQGTYYVYTAVQLPSNFFAIYKRVTIAKGQTINLPLNDK